MLERGKFLGFHHIEFWVSNAKQASIVYCARMGFKPLAYKGLETGSRTIVSHVIVQDKILLVFTSPLQPNIPEEMCSFLSCHGDEVRDVAFEVDNVDAIVKRAVEGGAKVLLEPHDLASEEGVIRSATIHAYGDITHTFLDKSRYAGIFMPGFFQSRKSDPLLDLLPNCYLNEIDHVVANLPRGLMNEMTNWYEKVLGFLPFWSIDDRIVQTEFTGLKSVVVSDPDNKVMLTLNEQAKALKKGQIEEFLEYHNGPGIQHIAFTTADIITSVRNLKSRGFEFLESPPSYYDDLRTKLNSVGFRLKEDFQQIMDESVLIDFNELGEYLLQIVSNVVQDRPTLFLEVIQRHKHTGFGAGNFKNLYTVFEQGQQCRGNLR